MLAVGGAALQCARPRHMFDVLPLRSDGWLQKPHEIVGLHIPDVQALQMPERQTDLILLSGGEIGLDCAA